MNTKNNNKHVYFLENTMYINVTNLCTNECVFCIRELNDCVEGANLWMESQNISAQEIIEEIKNNSPQTRDGIVFCGYGEPLIKIEEVKQAAKFIKENYKELTVRVNTNGHANLIHKRNIVPELVGLIDKISVSLNAHNSDLYYEISKPKLNIDREAIFEAVKEFIKECKKNNIDTTASIVKGFNNYEVNVEVCQKIANELGVNFRVREWLNSGYK